MSEDELNLQLQQENESYRILIGYIQDYLIRYDRSFEGLSLEGMIKGLVKQNKDLINAGKQND